MVQSQGTAGDGLSVLPPPVRPGFEDIVRETIESWHGLCVTDFTTSYGSQATIDRSIVVVKVVGWSPSLHSFTYDWQGYVDPSFSAEEQANQFLDDVRPEIKQQAARGYEALDIGIQEPVDIKSDSALDHMQVERSVVALMAREYPDVPAALLSLLREVHDQHNGEDNGGIIIGDGSTIHGCTIKPEIILGENSVYDGMSLYNGELYPETLLMTVVGRRLGDLASVPDEIADRIIVSAENGLFGARFDFCPDFMSAKDI